ncbi:hypothetical protein Tco_0829917, partial [Tanacetum coccineum]
QQKALDDALVAPADRLEFEKCNMRLKIDIKPKEATFHVVLDALALTPFYRALLITADVPTIYMQEFWATISVHRQVFKDLLLEQDILSFIRDLGHTRDITYLADVNVDYLHQPWRAFATIINKCLSGKETGMDKIHLLFQIEYKDAKKTNKMSYPRFIKIIIDYFMSKDPSILRRNKMFWHTTRDDTLFTSIRCISKHKDTQNPVQATTKGTKLKSKAKVTKPDKKKQPVKKPTAIGLDVLSEVPDEQQQKSSAIDEGTDSEDEDDNDDDDGDNDDDGESDDQDDDSDDERTETDSDEIPDSNLTNVDQTEYEEEDVDDRVRTPSDYELTDDEKLDDEETMDDEEDDEVIKELYDDVNVKLENDDTEMTDADQGASEQQNVSQESGFEQEEEDAHLLNLENPSPADNEIASLMETSAHHATAIPEITFGFTTTTPPPPPFFNPILQQQTPTSTTTTSTNPTVTLPEIPNFASVFKFDQRVSALESEMSEFKQTNQFVEAISSISGIVDTYLASKMKEVVDVVVQLQTNKLREEAQAENQEFLNQIEKYVTESVGAEVLVRSTNQPQTAYVVAASLSEFKRKKILIDKMEANKSINRSDNQQNLYNALVESYNSDKDIITSYGDVVLLKTGRDDQEKDETPLLDQTEGRKEGNLSSDKSIHAEEPSHIVKDSGMQQDQEFVTRDNDEQPADKEISQAALAEEPPTSFDEFNDTLFDFSAFVMNRLKITNLTQEILVGPAFNLLKGTCKSITELEYHLEECPKATTDRLDWHNPKNKPYLFDLRKPLPLIQDHRGRQIIPKDYFINKYLEYLKGGDLSRRYSTSITKTKAAITFLNFRVSIQAMIPLVEARGVVLGQNLAIGKHFKTGLVGYHVVDDDGLFLYCGCCSWKRTWSMA